MTSILEKRKRIEALFDQLLSHSNHFSEEERAEIRAEFSVHGEYKLALCTYAGICVENGKLPLDVVCKPIIEELEAILDVKSSRFKSISGSLDKLTYK